MTISSYKKHKIYLAAIFDYALGSNNPEEVDYFRRIKAEIYKSKNNRNIGLVRKD